MFAFSETIKPEQQPIVGLAIFPHYSLDLEVLYGSVDGQKFEFAAPPIKARYSRRYGRGQGCCGVHLSGTCARISRGSFSGVTVLQLPPEPWVNMSTGYGLTQ
jgi:hypothetical protein